jgi:Leucine-rich repeat (LRR) protein
VVQDSGGSAIPGVNLARASDNEAAATVSIDGSVTAVANGVANITASALGVTSNAVEITVDATLRLNTTDLADGAQTIEYSETLSVSGGDGNYVWSVVVGGLPSDLSLAIFTGEIFGAPTVVETQNFTIEVASADGQSAQQALSINVTGPPILGPDEHCHDYSTASFPTFEDGTLETEIRNVLGIGPGDALTCGMLEGITELFASGFGIGSLVGIQNLEGLITLDLFNNSIFDIDPLSLLTSLITLDLGFNFITDITVLGDLTSLVELYLGGNSITDASPLAELTDLEILSLFQNLITDISPLSRTHELVDSVR